VILRAAAAAEFSGMPFASPLVAAEGAGAAAPAGGVGVFFLDCACAATVRPMMINITPAQSNRLRIPFAMRNIMTLLQRYTCFAFKRWYHVGFNQNKRFVVFLFTNIKGVFTDAYSQM
jgi:hypothetical protein